MIKPLLNLDIDNFEIDRLRLPFLDNAGIRLSVARLDKIHPAVSGNKLYKLYYFLEMALEKNISIIKTYGGPYSNHLLATASACQQMNLPSVALIRGERPNALSNTLIQCQHLGMKLIFMEREVYRRCCNVFEIDEKSMTIPEGGFHPLGARGAKLITQHDAVAQATHVFLAVGTATTLAGVLQGLIPPQQLMAVPVLKGLDDITERLSFLIGNHLHNNLIINNDYHFGGYAKKSTILFNFMNQLYNETGLPTDFVYTGKMMYAVTDMIKKGKIKEGSNVLCLHTGGLQGNNGLAKGTLIF